MLNLKCVFFVIKVNDKFSFLILYFVEVFVVYCKFSFERVRREGVGFKRFRGLVGVFDFRIDLIRI